MTHMFSGRKAKGTWLIRHHSRSPSHLGVQIRTLLHQRADGEPEAVADAELVLHGVAGRGAGVRVVPLVRADPRHHEHGERDQQVGGQHVQPYVHRQRVHEGEQTRLLTGRHLRDTRGDQCPVAADTVALPGRYSREAGGDRWRLIPATLTSLILATG